MPEKGGKKKKGGYWEQMEEEAKKKKEEEEKALAIKNKVKFVHARHILISEESKA